MTTIAIAKKNGYAAIAVDSLTTFGNLKETAERVTNYQKMFEYKGNFIATSGWGAFQQALEDFLANTKDKFLFNNVGNIFQSSLRIHEALRDSYFLRPFDSDSDSFETSRGLMLVANANGIFSISDYRFVQEHTLYSAGGSGSDYALGAMFARFEETELSAEEIVTVGLRAAAEFDNGTGFPITCESIRLA